MSESLEDVLARYGFIVRTTAGFSMLPMLRPRRDLIVVRPVHGTPKKYDVALYRRDNGDYILHRILRRRGDGYVFCGDHQWQPEYGIRREQILGVLTAFVRDGREIQVTDRAYRLYAHLCCDFFWARAAVFRFRDLAHRALRRWRKVVHGSERCESK